MEKKLRKREIKNNAELVLLKFLPILFMLLLYMMSTSIGLGAEGTAAPGLD